MHPPPAQSCWELEASLLSVLQPTPCLGRPCNRKVSLMHIAYPRPTPAGGRGRFCPGRGARGPRRTGGWPLPECDARSLHAPPACSPEWGPCASPTEQVQVLMSNLTAILVAQRELLNPERQTSLRFQLTLAVGRLCSRTACLVTLPNGPRSTCHILWWQACTSDASLMGCCVGPCLGTCPP